MNKITALLSGTAALVASADVAPASGHQRAASISGNEAQRFIRGAPLETTLYDQNSNDTGNVINSQNYGSSFAVFDDRTVDDSTVTIGRGRRRPNAPRILSKRRRRYWINKST
jgi:hypothetical protein